MILLYTVKYRGFTAYIPFSALVSDETEIRNLGGFGGGMRMLM